MAALALGMRCIALAAEADPALLEATRRTFPNLVTLPQVELVTGEVFAKVLRRRQFSAILVARDLRAREIPASTWHEVGSPTPGHINLSTYIAFQLNFVPRLPAFRSSPSSRTSRAHRHRW